MRALLAFLFGPPTGSHDYATDVLRKAQRDGVYLDDQVEVEPPYYAGGKWLVRFDGPYTWMPIGELRTRLRARGGAR